MENHVFDRFAKLVAHPRSRRGAVKAAAAGFALVGGLGSRPVVASQQATPEADAASTEFLFVQTAQSGTFIANPNAGTPVANGAPTLGEGADYLLTLDGHSGHTVYFSDRPERIYGNSPTDQFLEALGFSAANPPNAALVTTAPDGDQIVIALELVTPVFDDEAGTITYGANILSEYEDEGLQHLIEQGLADQPPETFASASLFIDDCSDYTSCFAEIGGNGVIVGPIPSGPYGSCWSWLPPGCYPCNGTQEDLNGTCDANYDMCDGACIAV